MNSNSEKHVRRLQYERCIIWLVALYNQDDSTYRAVVDRFAAAFNGTVLKTNSDLYHDIMHACRNELSQARIDAVEIVLSSDYVPVSLFVRGEES